MKSYLSGKQRFSKPVRRNLWGIFEIPEVLDFDSVRKGSSLQSINMISHYKFNDADHLFNKFVHFQAILGSGGI